MVAVGLERAHAQVLGEGEGLAVMGCGLVDVWGLATHGNIAEETVGMRLIAASCVGTREFEKACGEGTSFIHTADEQTRLAQLGEHQRMQEHAPAGGQALPHLVQERQSLRSAPGQGIRRTQEGAVWGN